MGAVALVLAGALGLMWWNKEAGVGGMERAIKAQIVADLRRDSGIGLRPEDITLSGIRVQAVDHIGAAGEYVQVRAKTRVRRVPFRPSATTKVGEIAPGGVAELELVTVMVNPRTPVIVGPVRIPRSRWSCSYWLVSSKAVTEVFGGERPGEMAWAEGKGPDVDVLFDASLGVRDQVFSTGAVLPEDLVPLFWARHLRQEGRFAEAAEVLKLVDVDLEVIKGWGRAVETELALTEAKSRDLNPGEDR